MLWYGLVLQEKHKMFQCDPLCMTNGQLPLETGTGSCLCLQMNDHQHVLLLSVDAGGEVTYCFVRNPPHSHLSQSILILQQT